MCLRRADDLCGKSELFTDEERIGFSRHTDADAVCGAERFDVEFTAGVLHAGRFQRKELELRIVRRRHDFCARRAHVLDDRDSQRRTLCRVGARAELVHQNERSRPDVAQDLRDVADMSRERRQALFDALLVADVGKDVFKHAHGTRLVRRDQIAVLRHGAQQSGCFQRHGLTARVGARDDQRIVVKAERNVDRHGLSLFNQRMARAHKRKAVVVAHFGLHGVLIQRQMRLGEQDVNLQHRLIAQREHRFQLRDLPGKCRKDAVDLLFLKAAQLHDARVRFHNGRRFDEKRRARRRDVVDHAADLAAVLRFDGDNEPSVSQGDDRVLQVFACAGIFDHRIELVADGVLRCADLPANVVQCVAGRIRHLALRQDGVKDILLELRLRRQRIEEIVDGQRVVLRHLIP